ncbi:MAG: hypothetical protein ACJ74W_13460 [Pyrinomonadaceae bacterium]
MSAKLKLRIGIIALTMVGAVLLQGCAQPESPANTAAPAAPALPPAAVVNSTPLPDSSFKMALSVAAPPKELKAGEKLTLQVKVKNTSAASWPALERAAGGYQVHVGNHWLDAGNKTLQLDDARGTLAEDLKPGGEVTIPLEITAPAKPGSYVLELDMVQEGVSWFRDKGAQTLRLPVQVK